MAGTNRARIAVMGAVAMSIGFCSNAHADDGADLACIQAKAVYSDSAGRFQLRFMYPDPASAVVAHRIVMMEKGSDQRFEGEVIWNQGFSQPNISVTFPCHVKGEQPSDEICRYEAVPYMLLASPEGPIGLAKLPGSEEPAAATLLLPHLARAWYYGPRNTGWSEHVPAETFVLSRCQAD